MKAAPVIEALSEVSGVRTTVIHAGKHNDQQMSELFFEQLGIPKPDVDLGVGSGSHGEQTGQIMIRIEPLSKQMQPHLVIVFGDVNSTVAAALCAAKLGIKVAHVEVGLRSFDRAMPEELNRIVTDHLSDYLFTTEPSGKASLMAKRILEGKIQFVGDVMVNTLLKHRDRSVKLEYWKTMGLSEGAIAF